jgi:hypothetical protein
MRTRVVKQAEIFLIALLDWFRKNEDTKVEITLETFISWRRPIIILNVQECDATAVQQRFAAGNIKKLKQKR